jgi:hypothetical protein
MRNIGTITIRASLPGEGPVGFTAIEYSGISASPTNAPGQAGSGNATTAFTQSSPDSLVLVCLSSADPLSNGQVAAGDSSFQVFARPDAQDVQEDNRAGAGGGVAALQSDSVGFQNVTAANWFMCMVEFPAA